MIDFSLWSGLLIPVIIVLAILSMKRVGRHWRRRARGSNSCRWI